ncbi:MAG: transporter substrate-binding domain-containing protein [Desulfobacterales bacterium]|nr:transporter substrate-binding domain-containing protein [Desulfobacterales bacterium]
MLKKSLLLITVFLFSVSSPLFAKNFEIATGEWAPYVSETMPDGGPTAKIVAAAIEAAGHTVTFKYMPWKRTEVLTQQGKMVATFPWTMADSFKDVTYQSTPLAHQRMVFFYLKDKFPGWDYTGLEELKKVKIGASQGYSYVDIFANAGIKPVYVKDVKSSLKMMLHNRVDVVPESQLVGWQTIKDQYASDASKIASSKTPLFEKPLHLMVSKTHPDGEALYNAFEKGLKIIRDNGTFKKLLEEHGLSE